MSEESERQRDQTMDELLFTSPVFRDGDKEANLAAADNWGKNAQGGIVAPFTPYFIGRDVVILGDCHRPTDSNGELVTLDGLPESADISYGLTIDEEEGMGTLIYQGIRHVIGEEGEPLGFFAIMTGPVRFANKVAAPALAQ